MNKELTFFLTLNKLTEELILQEGNLISLKIPKLWQKPDANINNPALWVCHLPTNSLGISFISLYPSELVIKKKKHSNEDNDYYSEETEEKLEALKSYDESSLIIYQGHLEPNGENEKEKFYRCKLKKQEAKTVQMDDGMGGFFAIIIIVVIVIVFIGIMNKN